MRHRVSSARRLGSIARRQPMGISGKFQCDMRMLHENFRAQFEYLIEYVYACLFKPSDYAFDYHVFHQSCTHSLHIDRLQLTSSPPCWMTINKRILMSFIVPVIQHGHQGLCHLNLSGMVANHLFS